MGRMKFGEGSTLPQVEEVAKQYVQQIEPLVKTEYVEVEKIVEKIVEVPVSSSQSEDEKMVFNAVLEDLTYALSQIETIRENQILTDAKFDSILQGLHKTQDSIRRIDSEKDSFSESLKSEIEAIKAELKTIPKPKEPIELQRSVNKLDNNLVDVKGRVLVLEKSIKKTSVYGIILSAAVLGILLLLY